MHLILLPGMDGTGALFAPLVAVLPASITPHVISYPVDRDLSYDELVDFVLPLLPAAPFVVLGESFSGPVAIGIAARQPAHLAGVILCVTFARSTWPNLLRIPLPSFGLPFTAWTLRVSRAAWVWRLLLGRHFSPALHKLVQGALDRNQPDVLVGRLRAMSSVDVTAPLASLRARMMYLRAGGDRIVPRKAGEQVRAINPGVAMQEIPGPHFLLQVAPREAADVIRAFCDRAATP